MKKIFIIATVGLLFTACKPKVEATTTSSTETTDSVATIGDTLASVDTLQQPSHPKGKLAATATQEVVGTNGKTLTFTYDNNASTVSFEWNGKTVVLTSKEKISDIPNANGRTYTNEDFTFVSKNGITITDNKKTDKKNDIIFQSKN